MKFYVASGLQNRSRAADMVNFLTNLGLSPAYNWTVHGDVRAEGEERMKYVASNETAAVAEAELVLFMLPGGAGTHTELGIALSSRSNKRIIMWSESGKEFGNGPDTCVFYHHHAIERISGSVEALKAHLRESLI